MQNLDQQLFLALNFDGGPVWDRIMLILSGTTMWIPLYAVILWLVWRRSGWRGMLLFLVLMAAAVALADMVAGIFKHNGLLGGLLPDFEPRWRPPDVPRSGFYCRAHPRHYSRHSGTRSHTQDRRAAFRIFG